MVLKGKTVVGMPQSIHYNNKYHERIDAENWMARMVKEGVGGEVAREKMILTWRLYPLPVKRQRNTGLIFTFVTTNVFPDLFLTLPSLSDLWRRRQSGTRRKKMLTFCFFSGLIMSQNT